MALDFALDLDTLPKIKHRLPKIKLKTDFIKILIEVDTIYNQEQALIIEKC